MRSEGLEKKPLYSQDAEKEVLGCMLSNSDIASLILESLDPKDFQKPVHREIFKAIKSVNSRGDVATPEAIQVMMEDNKEFNKIQDPSYVSHLAGDWRVEGAARDNAKLVKNLSTKRQIITLGTNMCQDAHDLDKSGEEQIEEVEEALFRLSTQGNVDGNNLRLLDAFARQAAENIKKAVENNLDYGIRTGLRRLDQVCGGFMNTDLIVLAGRPGMGKTGLAITTAANIAERHSKDPKKESAAPVAFFSLEMSGEQIGARILSSKTDIPIAKLRKSEISSGEIESRIVPALTKMNIPFHIDDTPGLSINMLRTRLRRLKRKENVGVAIVDYLQLMRPLTVRRNEGRVEELSRITRELKIMAKELNLVIIALSQLSRAVEQREDRRPQLSDLRESGSIEQDADMVIFIYREAYYLRQQEPSTETEEYDKWKKKMDKVEGRATLIIGKNRHGETGNVNVKFESFKTWFSDLDDRDLELDSKESIIGEKSVSKK